MERFFRLIPGLYLYLLVVETFSRIEVINKFVIYAVVGYGECFEFIMKQFHLNAYSIANFILMTFPITSQASLWWEKLNLPRGDIEFPVPSARPISIKLIFHQHNFLITESHTIRKFMIKSGMISAPSWVGKRKMENVSLVLVPWNHLLKYSSKSFGATFASEKYLRSSKRGSQSSCCLFGPFIASASIPFQKLINWTRTWDSFHNWRQGNWVREFWHKSFGNKALSGLRREKKEILMRFRANHPMTLLANAAKLTRFLSN